VTALKPTHSKGEHALVENEGQLLAANADGGIMVAWLLPLHESPEIFCKEQPA
jgi:hypothetical protein